MTDSSEPQAFFGHPRGVLYIGGTELWDRISFHGMQALLILYMVEQLFLPGHVEHIVGFEAVRAAVQAVTGPLSAQAFASQVFGLYVGLIYFVPVFGGWLGDRFIGRRNSVVLGGLLMTAGHFSMAFDQSFFLALLLLILGAGILRGNLAPQLGELYDKEDRRRGSAFQLYGMTINLGAFIAPLVTGLLGKEFGWHIAFGFAGVGMLAGVIVYVSGRRFLPPERPRSEKAQTKRPLTAEEKRNIFYLVLLVPVMTAFWIAQSQVWNIYNIWVRDHIDLQIGGWTMPVPWLQSLDGLAPFAFIPLMLWVWRRQARRGSEPGDFSKMAIGCFIFGAGTLWLAGAGLVAGSDGRAPLLWAVMFHIVSNIGWIYFSPTVSALYSRLAPAPVNATMMSASYLAVFMGSVISGRLGGLYEAVSPAVFWTIHAAIVAGGGVAILLLGMTMRKTAAAPAAAPVLAVEP